MPIEVEAHTVPYFKAPVNGKAERLWQDHTGTGWKRQMCTSIDLLILGTKCTLGLKS